MRDNLNKATSAGIGHSPNSPIVVATGGTYAPVGSIACSPLLKAGGPKEIVVQPRNQTPTGTIRLAPGSSNPQKEQKLLEMKLKVYEFLQETLDSSISSTGSFHLLLKDGIVLCNLANKLRPGVIDRISMRPLPFLQMENISNFVRACRDLGVPSTDLFQTVDLFEGKDMYQVAICILTLARIFGKGSASKPVRKLVDAEDALNNSTTRADGSEELAPQEASISEKVHTTERAPTVALNSTLPQLQPVPQSSILSCALTELESTESAAAGLTQKLPAVTPESPLLLVSHKARTTPQPAINTSPVSTPLQKLPSLINLSAQLRQARELRPSQLSINSFSAVDSSRVVGGSVNGTGNFASATDPSITTHSSLSIGSNVGVPPVVVDSYQLGNCIGKGQFGAVYKALNRDTGHVAAIKRISLENYTGKEVDELMQEVELLESLSHPNIVQYIGFIRESNYLNIILEYVENGSLYSILKTFGPLAERLAVNYVVQILQGLHYLHERKVVHCDLKAANILNTKEGVAKLSDFGVSQQLSVLDQNTKAVAGTPNWMAPEIIALDGATTQSDIWSLGCTVVELLTGKPPYHELNPMTTMFRIVEDDRPPFPENISPEASSFLQRCFCKDPSVRATADELLLHPWIRNNSRISMGKSPSISKLSLLGPISAVSATPSIRDPSVSSINAFASVSNSMQSSTELVAALNLPTGANSRPKHGSNALDILCENTCENAEDREENASAETGASNCVQPQVPTSDELKIKEDGEDSQGGNVAASVDTPTPWNANVESLKPFSAPIVATANSAPVTPKMSKKHSKKDHLERKSSMFAKRPDPKDALARQNTPHDQSETDLRNPSKDKCTVS